MLKKSFDHLQRLIKFGWKYKTLTFNLNTKQYWNDKLQGLGEKWRDGHYRHTELTDIFAENPQLSVVDVGCALGDGCIYLKEKFPDINISGCDFSEVGIAKAQARSKDINFFRIDVRKEEMPRKFDIIMIIETLEHFDDPFEIVNKLLPYARNSIIVSVPLADQTRKVKKAVGVGEHRYHFYEDTFEDYNHDIVMISDYMDDTESKCIIYRIYSSKT